MYALLLAMLAAVSPPQDGGYLYKTVLLRAAPGHLLDVIDLLKDRLPVYDAAGDERPFIIRHSQGDHWDLMLIFPIESMSVYHASEREERRSRAAAEAGLSEEAFLGRLQDLVAFTSRCSLRCPGKRRNCSGSGRWRTITCAASIDPRT